MSHERCERVQNELFYQKQKMVNFVVDELCKSIGIKQRFLGAQGMSHGSSLRCQMHPASDQHLERQRNSKTTMIKDRLMVQDHSIELLHQALTPPIFSDRLEFNLCANSG
ncbi:hypothetical protein TNCV_3415711 [Trichonephila clavipes]|nr:hypothetical protein TNCV_3415711 [Trichonephila clavipes]